MTDEEPTVESLRERLEELTDRLDEAETEADLDELEADVDALETDIDAADLPEADEEDEPAPEEALTEELDSLTDDLEEERGPYADDVTAAIEAAVTTLEGGDWTDAGAIEAYNSVDTFLEAVDEYLDGLPNLEQGDDREGLIEAATGALEAVVPIVEDAELDPDDDAETIAGLIEATDGLTADLDDAEEWDDLSVREQLDEHGFYDALDHRKDFPPEWHAIKVYEKRGEPEKILLALDMFESDFMEEHCLEALERIGSEEALEEMEARASRRDQQAISILGTIGSEQAVETLLDFVDSDSNPNLQRATIEALGEIGSSEAVQPIADQLLADNEDVRSQAARSLGLIGDTRAIAPLADVLEDDDVDRVRASAAWALVQIGTEEALEIASQYQDDRAYLVQAEAEKAHATI